MACNLEHIRIQICASDNEPGLTSQPQHNRRLVWLREEVSDVFKAKPLTGAMHRSTVGFKEVSYSLLDS